MLFRGKGLSEAQAQDSEELLKFGQFAKRCGVSRSTVYHWRCNGRLNQNNGLVYIGDGRRGSPRVRWNVFVEHLNKIKGAGAIAILAAGAAAMAMLGWHPWASESTLIAFKGLGLHMALLPKLSRSVVVRIIPKV